MNNDENVNLETPNEEVTETVETPETPAETTEETLETPEVDVEQLQATNKKLFERAKKAEAEAKALKAKATPVNPSKASPPIDVDERILLAQGVPEELIEELKLRAPKHGGSLIKAQKDPKFVAVKESYEKEQKQKNSSLPASRGSGSVKPKKDFSTPGLTREEHRKMAMGTE